MSQVRAHRGERRSMLARGCIAVKKRGFVWRASISVIISLASASVQPTL